MNRRDFLQTAGGAAGATATATAAAGSATAQETTTAAAPSGGGGGKPDYGGYLDDVGNYDGTTQDFRGQNNMTVTVGAEGNGGNFAFGPPAIHIDNGATVTWEWSGKGGAHNVIHEEEAFNSGSPVQEAGTTFEHTFNEDGIYQYYCQPHKAQGMKGTVVVGTDYPTVAAGGGGAVQEQDPEHMGVPFQAHYVGLSTVLAILASLIFTFFLLKYGESPNTKGGNN